MAYGLRVLCGTAVPDRQTAWQLLCLPKSTTAALISLLAQFIIFMAHAGAAPPYWCCPGAGATPKKHAHTCSATRVPLHTHSPRPLLHPTVNPVDMPTTDLLKAFGLSRNPFTDRTAEKTSHEGSSLYVHSDLAGFTPSGATPPCTSDLAWSRSPYCCRIF